MENQKRPPLARGRFWFSINTAYGFEPKIFMENPKKTPGKGAFMVLKCAFMVVSGGGICGLFEGGWFCPQSLCRAGWGVGGVRVGGTSLSGGVLGAFLLRGAGWDFSACSREGMGAEYWKPN